MNLKKLTLICLTTFLAACLSPVLIAGEKPVEPFVNPSMADSDVYETHTRGRFTSTPGPIGPSQRLQESEIAWKPLGPYNGQVILYSSPYPDGRRVIWVGGYDRVAKLDAETLETLATYAIGDTQFFTAEETVDHVEKLNSQNIPERLTYLWDVTEEARPQMLSWYRMLSDNNEFYLPYRHKNGSVSLRVYGELDAHDPSSGIELRREWVIPSNVSSQYLYGMTMTNDGWIVLAFSDGKLVALAQDFASYHMVELPRNPEKKQDSSSGAFDTFVRNGVVVDENNGIYVVSRDFLQRVQWTGKELSLDEQNGAWQVAYTNETGVGSGSTPALMGWGNEDRLVLIADATNSNNLVAYWRDKIPSDWQGIPDMDRRVAGIEKIGFGLGDQNPVHTENGIVVYGKGAFINSFPVELEGLPEGKYSATYSDRVLARLYLGDEKGYEAFGATKIEWNPKTRSLNTAWTSSHNFAFAICSPSGATDIVYCWGARNGEWTAEGLDWNTGESRFHYILGHDQRFNALGGAITIAPNGAIDCGCHGGFGIVRVKPKKVNSPDFQKENKKQELQYAQ